MTMQIVKLSQLRLSPFNVRKMKLKAIDQLAADMLAHGFARFGAACGRPFNRCYPRRFCDAL